MNHWRARRHLPGLLDDTLPQRRAGRVEAHMETCAGCRRVLREMRLHEVLLQGLPAALVPLESSQTSDARLTSLARWALPSRVETAYGYSLSAVGAFAMVTLVAMVVWAGNWAPVVDQEPTGPISIAMALSDSQTPPLGWR